IEIPSAVRLDLLEEGAQGVVGRVASDDGELLRYLASLHITPGAPIQLVSRAPFAGPLRVRVANGSFHDEHVIGAELATKIWVEDVKGTAARSAAAANGCVPPRAQAA
ncbi:MAG: ferrous iron transport protein A, partial [Thermoflexales bacterium]|nr:ferrous iron transport protein A [Thermoflexales bacterium]